MANYKNPNDMETRMINNINMLQGYGIDLDQLSKNVGEEFFNKILQISTNVLENKVELIKNYPIILENASKKESLMVGAYLILSDSVSAASKAIIETAKVLKNRGLSDFQVNILLSKNSEYLDKFGAQTAYTVAEVYDKVIEKGLSYFKLASKVETFLLKTNAKNIEGIYQELLLTFDNSDKKVNELLNRCATILTNSTQLTVKKVSTLLKNYELSNDVSASIKLDYKKMIYKCGSLLQIPNVNGNLKQIFDFMLGRIQPTVEVANMNSQFVKEGKIRLTTEPFDAIEFKKFAEKNSSFFTMSFEKFTENISALQIALRDLNVPQSEKDIIMKKTIMKEHELISNNDLISMPKIVLELKKVYSDSEIVALLSEKKEDVVNMGRLNLKYLIEKIQQEPNKKELCDMVFIRISEVSNLCKNIVAKNEEELKTKMDIVVDCINNRKLTVYEGKQKTIYKDAKSEQIKNARTESKVALKEIEGFNRIINNIHNCFATLGSVKNSNDGQKMDYEQSLKSYKKAILSIARFNRYIDILKENYIDNSEYFTDLASIVVEENEKILKTVDMNAKNQKFLISLNDQFSAKRAEINGWSKIMKDTMIEAGAKFNEIKENLEKNKQEDINLDYAVLSAIAVAKLTNEQKNIMTNTIIKNKEAKETLVKSSINGTKKIQEIFSEFEE